MSLSSNGRIRNFLFLDFGSNPCRDTKINVEGQIIMAKKYRNNKEGVV